MAVLDLGCGKHPVRGALTVDIDPKVKPDLVLNFNDSEWTAQLPSGTWDIIYCRNVVNYLENPGTVRRFFKELYELLTPGGVLYLEFMNVYNGEGLRLWYPIVGGWLAEAGLAPQLRTKRHLVVPTGNVKVLALKPREGLIF